PLERGAVRDFPAEEADALAAVGAHHHALLAVVHPQRKALRALVGDLHAEEAGAEAGPVLERLGAHADVTEPLDLHARPPYFAILPLNMGLPARLGKCPGTVTVPHAPPLPACTRTRVYPSSAY